MKIPLVQSIRKINNKQLEPNLSFIGFNNLGSLYGETEHFAIE